MTHWNIHTYFLAGADEGGHSMVPPGGSLMQVSGPTISMAPATPGPCAPRPRVLVSTTPLGDGVLEVTVKADGLARLQIEDGPNWIIDPTGRLPASVV